MGMMLLCELKNNRKITGMVYKIDTFLRPSNIPHIWSLTLLALAALRWKQQQQQQKPTTRGEVEWIGNTGREPGCNYTMGREILKNSFTITYSSTDWGLTVGSVLYVVFCRVTLEWVLSGIVVLTNLKGNENKQ